MKDLVGRVEFTEAEVSQTQNDLAKSNIRMPNFGALGEAFGTSNRIDEERKAEEMRLASERQARLLEQDRLAEEERSREERRIEGMKREEIEKKEAEERRVQLLRREDERRLAELEVSRRREAEERHRVAEAEERIRVEREEADQANRIREFANLTIIKIQAHWRGQIVRNRFYDNIDRLDLLEDSVTKLQGLARGVLARREYGTKLDGIDQLEADGVAIRFQANVRRHLVENRLMRRIGVMRSVAGTMINLQALIRGQQARHRHSIRVYDLRSIAVVSGVSGLQSLARAALVRRRVEAERKELFFVEPDVVGIQSHTRGILIRNRFRAWITHLHGSIDEVVGLQRLLRGALARRRYRDMIHHWQRNWDTVVRLQAAIRSSRKRNDYRELTLGTNVPISTIKNFLRLLDDSEFDFREEVLVESLRRQLIGAIKETQVIEEDVKDLDTKIALLVKNKITHEVARSQRIRSRVTTGLSSNSSGLNPSRRNELLRDAKDPFAPNLIDARTARKLELYQQLFWHLQTNPEYLSRWFSAITRGALEGGDGKSSDETSKSAEATTFGLFGVVQAMREEYLLLKLFKVSLPDLPARPMCSYNQILTAIN
jgi:Ras GTPase-activating-like protein IQGAP2/3